MKHSILKKKNSHPLAPKKMQDLAGVSPLKGISPSASTAEPRGAAIQHNCFPHRTFLPPLDFRNPHACCKVQSLRVVWEVNIGFPNTVLGQEINPAEIFAMKGAHSWVDLEVVFLVLWWVFLVCFCFLFFFAVVVFLTGQDITIYTIFVDGLFVLYITMPGKKLSVLFKCHIIEQAKIPSAYLFEPSTRNKQE